LATLPFREEAFKDGTLDFGDSISTKETQGKASKTSSKKAPLSEQEKIARICLYRSQNVGPVTYRNLLKRYKTATAALEALPDLASRGGLRAPLKLYSEDKVHQELHAHKKQGARLVVEGEADYPKALRDLNEAPPVLSLHGNPDLFRPLGIAIVGARNCSLNGKKMVQQLAHHLGQEGYTIISGLARGIDGQAHQSSLETGTIAVIAGGIDKIYPPEHSTLFAQIKEQGLIVAESIIGTEPQSTLFPRRNRLISGLSQGIIVVEAALQSGSLITARYAAEQNRDVFVVPGSPMDPRYRGSNALIRNGATLTTKAQDILEVLNEPYRQTMKEAAFEQEQESTQEQDNYLGGLPEPDSRTLEDLSTKIMGHLSSAPILLDELIRECSYSSSIVLSALLELELAGKITRHPGNKIST
tara:strand:+ start:961 stop:2205 length:1245 start_codon:yes stop_codon:yes gene_type:complete